MAGRLAAFDQVGFSYDGRPILEDASLTLSAGEVVGLLGLNGTGKTTTMRLIAGILDPERGQVVRAYRTLGYLPEERGLYRRLTVERYLRFVGELNGLSKTAIRPTTDRLIEQFRLEEYRGRRIEALSKGNQQKVQLAATLVPSPDLMLWDEPFSGLDALNQDLLLDVLRDLRSPGSGGAALYAPLGRFGAPGRSDLHLGPAAVCRVRAPAKAVSLPGPI